MNTYRQNELIPGRKIYLDNNVYVAVPEKELNKDCMIIYKDKFTGQDTKMFIKKGTKPVKKIIQEQKIDGRKSHWLCYFKWIPILKQESLEGASTFNPINKTHIDKMLEIKAKLQAKGIL